MKKLINRYALFSAFSFGLAALPAGAANTFYAPGDLILYFQQEGGTNTVYANLGNTATDFRDASSNNINFLNLNSTLTSAFGANWATDSSIYAGLAGVWGTSNTNSTLTNGDPHRTLYVSSSRNSVGTIGSANSTGWDLVTAGTGAMTTAASNIFSMNNTFETQYDAQASVSLTSVSTIDEQNPFLSPGIQGNAFGAFAGGVQQKGSASTFGDFGGAVGETEFALDLYRVLARNNISSQVAGDLRIGSYEGTVTVGSNGQVSLMVIPEPSSTVLIGLTAGAFVLRRRRSV